MMQNRLMEDPIWTWYSELPRMKASGTMTCRWTNCDTMPDAVEIWSDGVRKFKVNKI